MARRRGVRVAILAVVLILALPALSRADGDYSFFRIGTASISGTYFAIGAAIANAISKPPGSRACTHGGSCGVEGLVAVAQATQGSIENILAVNAGSLESGIAQSDALYWAYSGKTVKLRHCTGKSAPANLGQSGLGLLKKAGPQKHLRAIAGLYAENIHIVVRADSSITNLKDLKDKRVALGEPESATLADARLVLDAVGFGECGVKPEYLHLADAAAALAQGKIDAFFVVAGFPVPAITDLAATTPIRLLPVPPGLGSGLMKNYQFFNASIIPKGTYRGEDQDVPTIATVAVLIVGEQVPPKLIQSITGALWTDASAHMLEAAHPVGKEIKLDSALKGLVVPLHPGAADYYRSIGKSVAATP